LTLALLTDIDTSSALYFISLYFTSLHLTAHQPSMKSLSLCTALLFGLSSLATSHAAKSFAASNLYYAAGLKESQQTTLFEGLQSAGVKVLRVWLDGVFITAHGMYGWRYD
jgi:hypothetical protein